MILKNITKQKQYHAESNATEHKLISNWTSIESVTDKNGIEYQNIIGEEPDANYTNALAEIYQEVKSVADAITERGIDTDISADTATLKSNISAIPNKISYYGNATYSIKTSNFNLSPYNSDSIGYIKFTIPSNSSVKANLSISFSFPNYSDGSSSINYFGTNNDLKINVMMKESTISYEDALLQNGSIFKKLDFGYQPINKVVSGHNVYFRLKESYSLAENVYFSLADTERYVILYFNTEGAGIQPISYLIDSSQKENDMTGTSIHLIGSMYLNVQLIYIT